MLVAPHVRPSHLPMEHLLLSLDQLARGGHAQPLVLMAAHHRHVDATGGHRRGMRYTARQVSLLLLRGRFIDITKFTLLILEVFFVNIGDFSISTWLMNPTVPSRLIRPIIFPKRRSLQLTVLGYPNVRKPCCSGGRCMAALVCGCERV